MNWLWHKIWTIWTERTGNVAIFFTLSLPVVLGALGGGIDYSKISMARSNAQDAADSAAIGSARELYMANATDNVVEAIAAEYVAANLNSTGYRYQLHSVVLPKNSGVTVALDLNLETNFLKFVGYPSIRIKVSATAEVMSGGRVCMIGLDRSAQGTITLQNSAKLNAPNCAVYVNSLDNAAIKAKNSSVLLSEVTCTVGGYKGSRANFTPLPLTDCPVLEDPLAKRLPPTVGRCDYKNFVAEDESVVMKPGVYCGGIEIDDEADVTMRAGIYIIDGGMLSVRDDAGLKGRNVGIYLTGKNSGIKFFGDSSIDLTAPKDGPMAGLLIWQSAYVKDAKFEIYSNDARNLLGTIYLPQGELYIDAKAPIADRSAYTALVVKRLTLYSGPNLHLNTDYSDTPIPVPGGLGLTGRNIQLVH